jgi:uncharacterized membrane protein YccC
MAADALPAPGWPTRARLLAADLLVFEPGRLGWLLATRTVTGLALPILLAHALGQPRLAWVGLGAYLLAIGDCTDDGDRMQALRIAVGAGLGGFAVTAGVLLGGNFVMAVAGTMVTGIVTGMMGVYGNAFAAMSLPIAWAYVELGLPAAEHTLPNAELLGGLFTLGGLLMLVLTMALRFGGSVAPVRLQTASCFREIARYLDADRPKGFGPPETRVRAAIAEARRRAEQTRRAAFGTSRINQRAFVLIEIADRLYSIIGAMREIGETPIPECKPALLTIAGVLDGRDKPTAQQLRAALEKQAAAEQPNPVVGVGILKRRMIQELSHALSVATDDALPVLPTAPTTSATYLSAAFLPLLANLDRNSVVARHALRFAVVTSAAVMVFWVFPKPFGYWVPLTATVVLKPFAGMTLARGVQRACGTVTGIIVGLALMPLLPTVALQFGVVLLCFFAMMLVLPFNYSLAIVFLSAGLIPFEHVLTPGIQGEIGTDRVVATAIGAALALIGGHVLWPTFERRGLPSLLRACTDAMSAYANVVIGTAQGDAAAGDMQAARRSAGLALSNLQAGVQRSLTEIGGDPQAMTAILRASVALQRLSRALNALLQAAPILARSRPALAAFKSVFVVALADPQRGDLPIATLRDTIPIADGSPEVRMLSQVLDRLVSALEMLRDAVVSAAPPDHQ